MRGVPGFANLFSADHAASGGSVVPAVMANFSIISALLAFLFAQSFKVLATWLKERKLDLKQLIASGGMPSSHSATVVALATSIGFQDGFGGSVFAIAMVFACIVMYDASGVRHHAGRQAAVLNQIVYELPAEHPLSCRTPLRELLGHTPAQVVAGGMLGFITAAIAYLVTVLSAFPNA